jgi:hypothetical protein
VWARGPRRQAEDSSSQTAAAGPAALLTINETQQLRQLCGRVLYHTLSSSVRVDGPGAHHAFVATGDIPDEWIRDSSVQLGVYLPRIAAHPSLRQVGGARGPEAGSTTSLRSDLCRPVCCCAACSSCAACPLDGRR